MMPVFFSGKAHALQNGLVNFHLSKAKSRENNIYKGTYTIIHPIFFHWGRGRRLLEGGEEKKKKKRAFYYSVPNFLTAAFVILSQTFPTVDAQYYKSRILFVFTKSSRLSQTLFLDYTVYRCLRRENGVARSSPLSGGTWQSGDFFLSLFFFFNFAVM